MELGSRKDWAQEPRKPIGEGDGARVGGDEILARLDEEAGEPATRDFLVQCIANERAIIGFVVADTEPFAGQRRDQRFGETRIAVP